MLEPVIAIADLTFPEQLVVWALRHWMADRDYWPCVAGEFRRLCHGESGQIAAASFAQAAMLIAEDARRDLRSNPLHCEVVGDDEEDILALIAACQVRDDRTAAWLADRLVSPRAAETLLERLAEFAAAIQAGVGPMVRRRARHTPDSTVH
jgi:hypothetical protein